MPLIYLIAIKRNEVIVFAIDVCYFEEKSIKETLELQFQHEMLESIMCLNACL